MDLDNTLRLKLKDACQLFGGQKAVADISGIEKSNLGKWLTGQPTLSSANVESLLEAIGLPDGKPTDSRVHCWHVKGSHLKNLTKALSLFFPDGAKMARAPWVNQLQNIKAAFHDLPPLYAITDGQIRAIIRTPQKTVLEEKDVLPLVRWKTELDDSVIGIDRYPFPQHWTSGVPDINQFDKAWSSGKSVNEVIEFFIFGILQDTLEFCTIRVKALDSLEALKAGLQEGGNDFDPICIFPHNDKEKFEQFVKSYKEISMIL